MRATCGPLLQIAGCAVVALGLLIAYLLSASTLLFLAIILPCLGLGVWLVVVGQRRIGKAIDDFVSRASTTTAEILSYKVKIRVDDYGREHNTYRVVVQFDAESRQVTLRAKLSRSIYARLIWEGEPCLVQYDPSNPRVARLGTEHGYWEQFL